MKQAKKTAEYTIFKRRDGRYAVKGANSKWVNGDEKVSILQKEGLAKKPEPKKAEEPAKDESSADDAAQA